MSHEICVVLSDLIYRYNIRCYDIATEQGVWRWEFISAGIYVTTGHTIDILHQAKSVISHTMYPVPLLRGTEILVITFHFNRAEWQVKMLVKMIDIFCFSHLHTTNWTHRWTASSIQAWGSRGSRWPWKSWGSLCSRLTLLRDLELQPAMLVWISLYWPC